MTEVLALLRAAYWVKTGICVDHWIFIVYDIPSGLMYFTIYRE